MDLASGKGLQETIDSRHLRRLGLTLVAGILSISAVPLEHATCHSGGPSRPSCLEAVALYGTVLYLLREDAAAIATLAHAHDLRPEDSALKNLLARSAPR
jgi:hypothetical protein